MAALLASTFGVVFEAMLKILVIAVIAGLLVRRRIVTQEQIRSLSAVTVNVLLPCMIFSNIAGTFDPHALSWWWVLPLVGIAVCLAGLAVAWLLFRGELPAKRSLLAVASMQNAGYLSLPLGRMVYPDRFDQFALYCFLFILGYSPLLWSLGKHLATAGAPEAGSGWKGMLTPPFWANVAAVALVLAGLQRFIPGVLAGSIDLLGSATVPLATFVLGATVGSISLTRWPPWLDAVRALGTRLVVVPVLMIAALRLIPLPDPLLADFLVIQAASAPATAIALQVRKYGGDEQQLGAMLLLGYAACVVTLPAWVAVWRLAGP